MEEKDVKIRRPAWDGQFYPSDPKRLEEMVNDFLKKAPAPSGRGKVYGLVVPHAGYPYSGATAATGYKQLENSDPETVYVVAPSHGEFVRGVSIYDGDYYMTPLGQIKVDRQAARDLADCAPELRLSDEGHRVHKANPEHSLEVQLPFLQILLKQEFKLVPIVFHDYSMDLCRALGEALTRVVSDRNVIVASSDLYHGYSYEECVRIDDRTVESIKRMDPEEFCRGTHENDYQACGAGPIAALMFASAGKNVTVRLLARTNSADVTGMTGGWTVGYAALSFVRV